MRTSARRGGQTGIAGEAGDKDTPTMSKIIAQSFTVQVKAKIIYPRTGKFDVDNMPTNLVL
jgi:hypothetical protein